MTLSIKIVVFFLKYINTCSDTIGVYKEHLQSAPHFSFAVSHTFDGLPEKLQQKSILLKFIICLHICIIIFIIDTYNNIHLYLYFTSIVRRKREITKRRVEDTSYYAAMVESNPMNGGDGTYSYTKNSYFQVFPFSFSSFFFSSSCIICYFFLSLEIDVYIAGILVPHVISI